MTKTVERIRALPPLPEIDDVTRREFLIGAAGLLLRPAGCGTESGEGEQTASGETRTVEHELGTTEVPVEPQRVVAIHPIVIDTVLTLGVEPVGISETAVSFLNERLPDDTEAVGGTAQPNLEAIAALDPDLIVGPDGNIEEIYDELSQIAPTVGVYFGDGTGEWQRTGRAVAGALGRTEELEAELSAYDERAMEIGRRLGVPDEAPTVAVVRAGESLRFELPGIFSGSVLYRDVGLPLPPGLREPAEAGEPTLQISQEQFSRGDAEVLFLYSANEENPQQEIEAVREDPLFQTLQAVDSGNVYAVGEHWFWGSLIAANLILDDLFEHLVEGESTS